MSSPFNKVTNQEGGENVPEGVYLLSINEVALYEAPADAPPSQFDNGPRVRWKFGIEQVISATTPRATADNPNPKSPQEFVGSEIWDFSSTTMGPRSKARAWVEAVLDRELGEGETIDPSRLTSRYTVGTIGRSQTGRHKVINLMPHREQGSAPPVDMEAKRRELERQLAEMGAGDEREPAYAGTPSRKSADDPFD